MSSLVQLTSSIKKRVESSENSIDSPAAVVAAHSHSSDDLSPADLGSIRDKLSQSQGKQYWRSLEELANTSAFRELLHREFPSQASEWDDPVGRRRFLKLMGASLALAGLTACTRQPTETIAPYVRQPEQMVPGQPLYYATAMELGGAATGLLIESHEGRPTKIEGNPGHPASLGATDLFAQASVLSLYDPDRSQTLTRIGEITAWSAFLGSIRPIVAAQTGLQGAGLRILTETVTSPTLADQLRKLLAAFPRAKWHQYDAAGRASAGEGARLAFGQYVNTIYQFDKADVVLSLDSDFLSCGPGHLRYSRDFISRRRLQDGKTEMNRLYVVESELTNTGAKADNRLALRPSEVEVFARAVATSLGVQMGSNALLLVDRIAKWSDAITRDLKQHAGRSIVIAGDYQPPVVHALAHAMNAALGNVGKTVVYTDAIDARAENQIQSIAELAQDLDTGQIDLLLILGGNPVYNAPADLNFAERIRQAKLRVHLSLYKDETSELCQWHIPQAHYLESWGDTRAYDGTVSLIQPLIAPLYRGKTAYEVLAAFSDQPERTSYDIIRDYWRANRSSGGRVSPVPASGATAAQGQPAVVAQPPAAQAAAPGSASGQSATSAPASADFEQFWRRALHDGVIPNSQLQPKTVSVAANWAAQAPSTQPGVNQDAPLEICFRPDPTIYDGRFANNGWLQELPKPITKLTWDNAVVISPATAASRGLEANVGSLGGLIAADQIVLSFKDRSILAPILIMPGHADGCATVYLGYGRRSGGRVGSNLGYNAYAIRTTDAQWSGPGLQISKTGDKVDLAVTQLQHMIDTEELRDRDLVRSGKIDDYKHDPTLYPAHGHGTPEKHEGDHTPSLYPEHEYTGYKWGMTIDINACVGCNACVVSCQAENNIPVVGKEQVSRGREMHWLRVDSYFKGSPENPETYFQPVPCMHCENAPCEVVCPVAATVHSSEGLNDMVYNRCVGTRYCSNNCPYKVRRFNFLLYQDWDTPGFKLMRNPDVTVRSRGVMEKCTYCVQRISRARIQAEKEDRAIRDGEVKTACQAVCPTEAIIFGDINDSGSRVAKLKAEPRNYGLLAELNTQPRTTYLGAVRNPNPELE
ncbi:MAG TPA: TAT-variant-translocated molybdopterin oxidoreductase [Blastocatellia bacterium]|nr:TAT-variant-translocated molybdopterin oxidoreductase [Blastocatellia bacterium]